MSQRLPVIPAMFWVTALLWAGCLDDASPLDDVQLRAEEGVPPVWNLTAGARLGWIAAVGTELFVGDTTVGLTASETCPKVNFIMPANATAIDFRWQAPNIDPSGPGAGEYLLVISSPDHISFITPLLQGDGRTYEGPAPGIWEVRVNPNGAAVNLVWQVDWVIHGEGVAGGDLGLVHDANCM